MTSLARTVARNPTPAISAILGLLVVAAGNTLAGQEDLTNPRPRSSVKNSGDPCAIRALNRSELQGFRLYAPDKRRYLVNKDDETKVPQIYVGEEGSPA